MKMLIATTALVLMCTAPAFAGDHETRECWTGNYPEPLCPTKTWHRGRKTVVVEREPDVRILPYSPFVIVRNVYE